MNTNQNIPVGLATKLGAVAATLAGALALLATILDGDHSEESIAAFLGAVAMLYKIMDGRYKQATAKIVSDDYVAVEDAPEPEFDVVGGPQA